MAIQAQMYSGFGFGGSQDYLMDNGCGLNNLCFVSQQEQHLMQRVPPFTPKNITDDQQSVAFSQTLSAHIENQKSEIDLFIHSQNERLRMALQEQRRQQTSLLMKKYESKIQFLINQKEEEIEKAAKRTMELQEFLRRMEIESQAWQRAARENEAMAASLNSTIERLRETAAANNAADDAESCCCLGEEKIEIENRKTMVCKSCNYRESSVIMLPCRHLCSCRECDAFLDSCPVCKTVKKASIEALL
ncbi:boi-related E3 ubiquitin-protein ligase 1 [Phtheirospermum japonicum]|uniref:Boi-related E3 ubiquitin-protein ligase 1 n=1 Tax=Phtheirospermum japonicum TaxID=374723 RepID=A0A830C0R4_9LAMI|nr:boi-related E3 ubiquitin-protein ligase 1 [Phtheirospermum japonicum]